MPSTSSPARGGGIATSSSSGRGGTAVPPNYPVLSALDVSKRFGATVALDDVSLEIREGDARALVGRNGAGKSTLVAVVTGLLKPDSGRVAFGGAPAPRHGDRRKWTELVACVYQRSTIIPSLSVAENLFLNMQPEVTRGIVSWRALRGRAAEVLGEWDLDIDVDREAEDLTVEQKQIVEICRALLQGTRFLILDEPTAELDGREIERLFQRLARLRQTGVTLLYISHHLEEIYEVCDSVTVLRDGRLVMTAPVAAMHRERLVEAMVGAGVEVAGVKREQATAVEGDGLLDVEDLCLEGTFEGVSFTVRKGEIVGLAGLAGSGKAEVGDVIVGLLKPTRGVIRIEGRVLPSGDVGASLRLGAGYVPQDRHGRGLVLDMSVGENLTLTLLDHLGRAGFVSPGRRTARAESLIDALGIVTSSSEQAVSELSGGNQQKVVMGRALASEPRVLVLTSPTLGVDIASKEGIFEIVSGALERGAGALIISDELDELTRCDRILVMFKGRLTREFCPPYAERELVKAMEGFDGA